MTDKEAQKRDSLECERESLPNGGLATETIDLDTLIAKDVTDSGDFVIYGEIWTTAFGKVIQALPIPVLLVDQSCNVIGANQACRKIGAGYEKAVGRPFSRLFAMPSAALQSESLVSTVLSTRKTSIWEALLKIDKNSMWGRLTFRAIRIRDQRFLLVLVEDLSLEKKQSLLDRKYKKNLEKRVAERTEELKRLNNELFDEIAYRKRSEEALRESEERFRSIFENYHVVMLIIDPETGKIEDASPGASAFYGYTREELKSKKISDINTLSPEQVFERMQMATSQQHRYFDFQHRLANGEIRDVEVCTGPIVLGGRTFLFSVINDVTERKRLEAARVRSEKKYRSLFDESRDGVYADLRGGEITDANPSFLEMLGYVKEEMIGKNIRKLYLNPADRPKYQSEIEKEGFVKDYEVKFRKKDGTPVDCLLTSSVQFADDGSVVGYRGIIRDVTERKRTSDALKESEKRYRTLFEAASDAIYIVQAEGDRQGRIVSANKEAAQMHGYTVAELLQMNIADLDTPESAGKVGDRMKRLLRRETLREVTTHRRKDGTVFPVEMNARLIEVGDRKYILAIDRDITDREKAQTALRESEQRLRLISDSSPVGITIVQDAKYVYVNPSFVRMFGYEGQDEIIGLPIETLYAPGSRDLILGRQSDRSEGKGVPSHYEAIGLTRGGTRFDLETWETEIEYQGRRSSLAFVMDVSEAKSLRSQLLQAQKMEAIGTLAGGIAHDFNNLLTVILGYSELIVSEKEEGDKDYEDLTKIVHAARTAGDMVQQILAFSRKTETRPRPTDLNKQVQQLRKMLSRLIPRIIEVEISLDPSLPTVNADPAQIEQVLMNLAVNARDAMPSGGRLLIETQTALLDEEYCRSHLQATQGPHALLVVSDTGVGIARATMDRIFEPFFSTKKAGQGTGLGLAMVYGIVKSHGGHITCESEPDRGTTFRIYLPVHEVEGDRNVMSSGEFSALGTGTILLADDERFVRQLGQRILERAGYTVIAATNGKEAVEVYREKRNQISLVILDLVMPVMDGSQCLEEILRLDPRANVLIASGLFPDRGTQEALERGATGFVRKPYTLKQLLKSVRNALNENHRNA